MRRRMRFIFTFDYKVGESVQYKSVVREGLTLVSFLLGKSVAEGATSLFSSFLGAFSSFGFDGVVGLGGAGRLLSVCWSAGSVASFSPDLGPS
jgi:hypothetical protein